MATKTSIIIYGRSTKSARLMKPNGQKHPTLLVRCRWGLESQPGRTTKNSLVQPFKAQSKMVMMMMILHLGPKNEISFL